MEATHGRWELVGYDDRTIGKAEGVRRTNFSWPLNGGYLRGTAYFLKKLYLEYGHAMLLLQGVNMQRLFGPNYLFYSGKRCPAYASRPHLLDVHLATISEVPKALRLEEVVHILRACS